jgi:hypothetical protein
MSTVNKIEISDGDNNGSGDFFSSLLGFCFPRGPTLPVPDPTADNYLIKLLEYEYSRTSHDRFNYLRCLAPVDRLSFQLEMVSQIEKWHQDRLTQEAIIKKGGMKMGTWRSIMKAINLQSTYKLWRSAYWGENAGNKEIVRDTSNSHNLVEQYKGSNGSKVVNVLFSSNTIWLMPDFFIRPARWNNENVSIWEEECD